MNDRLLNTIVLLLLALSPFQTKAADAPPNIVFIFADDWGWGDLSCHGHPYLKTPNIDRLAGEGIDFHQFNVCNPVCSPSRTAAMTGHFPARHSVHQHFADHEQNRQRGMGDWLDPSVVMLPRILQQAGYRTGHFGKWHLTNSTIPDAPQVQEYGFDESAVFTGPAPHADHNSMMDAAVRFIESNKGRPFFINVWLHETHTPHFPSDDLLAKYSKLGDRERVYAAIIDAGDRKVGRVLETLDTLGLSENTIVIFSSDNGPEWTAGEDGKLMRGGLGMYYSVGDTGGLRGRKRSLFEGGVRTPFIVRWPGRAPANLVDKKTSLAAVDLLPTLCAAANVAMPKNYSPDGENMLAAFEGKPAVRTKPLFWQWQGTDKEPDWWPRLAVRQGDWKLYLSADGGRAELYNLLRDPQEQRNVADNAPKRVAELKQLATAWQATIPNEPPAHTISKLSGY